MLHRMKRIQVVGPRKDLHRVVDTLYHAGTVHLEDVCRCVSSACICLERIDPEKEKDILGHLDRIGSMLYTLPKNEDPEKRALLDKRLGPMSDGQILENAAQAISELEWSARELATRKSDLEFRITALDRYKKVIEKLRHIEHELPLLENYEVNILIIQAEFEPVLRMIKEELGAITRGQFEFLSTSVDDESIAAIAIFHKKFSEPAHAFLFSANVNEVRLPREFVGMKFTDMLVLFEKRRGEALEEIRAIDRDLEKLSGDWYQELSALKDRLEDMKDEHDTFNKFGQSGYTFVIMGWVPGKYLKRTRKMLHEAFGDRVVVEELKTTSEELMIAPTFYDNPSFVRPFEFLMGLVRPPRYMETDPSPLVALFFPLFFGIMVGDIGYGLIILAISILTRIKYASVGWIKDLSGILAISSVWAIMFGFLFGELFGNLGEKLGWLHPMHVFGVTLNRIEAIIPMLVFVIMIGVVHVFLGLGIGMMNAIAIKSKKHLAEKAGMMGALSGLLTLIGCAGGVLPQVLLYPAIILIIVSIPAIIYGGGIFGTIELVSAMGNILSYARLMAIGMASVILALVANEFAGTIGILFVGVIAAVLLHALNLVLALFSPSIHALRLHMVEFFSKFYEGGGIPYRPFSKTGT